MSILKILDKFYDETHYSSIINNSFIHATKDCNGFLNWFFIKYVSVFYSCGSRRIRTSGDFTLDTLAMCCFRPLSHTSLCIVESHGFELHQPRFHFGLSGWLESNQRVTYYSFYNVSD